MFKILPSINSCVHTHVHVTARRSSRQGPTGNGAVSISPSSEFILNGSSPRYIVSGGVAVTGQGGALAFHTHVTHRGQAPLPTHPRTGRDKTIFRWVRLLPLPVRTTQVNR